MKALNQFLTVSLFAFMAMLSYGLWVSGEVEKIRIAELKQFRLEQRVHIAESKKIKNIIDERNVQRWLKKNLVTFK